MGGTALIWEEENRPMVVGNTFTSRHGYRNWDVNFGGGGCQKNTCVRSTMGGVNLRSMGGPGLYVGTVVQSSMPQEQD